jgi:hypothetical protein
MHYAPPHGGLLAGADRAADWANPPVRQNGPMQKSSAFVDNYRFLARYNA